MKTPDGNQTARRLPRRVEKLTEQQVRELIAAYMDGDSVYVLARRFGIHRQAVSAHLRRAGIARRRQGEPTVKATTGRG